MNKSNSFSPMSEDARNEGGKMPDIRRMKPSRKNPSWVSIAVFVGVSLLLSIGWMFFSQIGSKGKEVSLNRMISDVSEKEFDKLIIHDTYVVLEQKEKKKIDGKEVEVVRRQFTPKGDIDFVKALQDEGVELKDKEKSIVYQPDLNIPVGEIISFVLLSIGLGMVFMMVRGMQGSGGKLLDFGQSKAKLIFGKKTGVTFDDVAGIEEVKEELVEIVDFLKNPKKYMEIGARIPRGVLLVGSPGTGKTLLAKAVAGEAGVPFFHTSGSEFEEMLVGAGASRVRDLFKKAKKAAPCIIFIDEIDAVAKKRGSVMHAGHGEQTLNQILVEMDGLENRENVIILAATNRPDVLDPAILRPGRFDRMVTVKMPDNEGRKEILEVHSKDKKFEDDVDMDIVARKTIGYSGADLENLLNEAAIMAVKDGRKKIKQEDLMESYLKVKLGRKKKSKRTEEDLKRVAYHEAGHAVVAKFTKDSDPVEKISIISRGMTGGVTVYVPEEDSTMTTKSKMLARLRSVVGGKIAEEIFLGQMSTGSSGDIKMATDIARAMVKIYGMSEKLGFIQYDSTDEGNFLGYDYGGPKEYSDQTAQMIDEEIKRIVDEAERDARKILEDNGEVMKKLADILLEKEVMDRPEFDKLFG